MAPIGGFYKSANIDHKSTNPFLHGRGMLYAGLLVYCAMKKLPPSPSQPSAYVAAELGALKAMRRPARPKLKTQEDEEKPQSDTPLTKQSTNR